MMVKNHLWVIKSFLCGGRFKMIFDFENKILQVKIVYYGPAMSGKTTSVKYLGYLLKPDSKIHYLYMKPLKKLKNGK